MSTKSILKLDWCSHAAAKYAVENWHYSKTLPAGKAVFVGVWERGRYIGAVVISRGANNHIGSPYGLSQTGCCELTRVALTQHAAPASRILAIALRFIKKQSPGLRLVVSYADPEQGHNGGIYQACGWLYVGTSQPQREKILNGKIVHKRTVFSRCGTAGGGIYSKLLYKHKYLMPLDAEMRERIMPLAKPYPKRAGSTASDAPGDHPGEGGATPTPALHLSNTPTREDGTPFPQAQGKEGVS